MSSKFRMYVSPPAFIEKVRSEARYLRRTGIYLSVNRLISSGQSTNFILIYRMRFESGDIISCSYITTSFQDTYNKHWYVMGAINGSDIT